MKDNCKYFEKLFLNYINNSLNVEDQGFCNNHFRNCEKCKNNLEFQEVKLVWQKLDSYSEIPVSNNFMAKLQREVVLIEEKNRIYWFKLDSFINMFRVPIAAVLIIVFSFTTDLPYAKAEKNGFELNTKKLEMNIKKYSKKSLSDAIKDIKNIIKK